MKAKDENNENSLCDLGSGAGFPGIVIKIFYPELNIVLVDSLNKRINFLNTVIKELGLEKIEASLKQSGDLPRVETAFSALRGRPFLTRSANTSGDYAISS